MKHWKCPLERMSNCQVVCSLLAYVTPEEGYVEMINAHIMHMVQRVYFNSMLRKNRKHDGSSELTMQHTKRVENVLYWTSGLTY